MRYDKTETVKINLFTKLLQTGSGKSYLLNGSESDPGIVPLVSMELNFSFFHHRIL